MKLAKAICIVVILQTSVPVALAQQNLVYNNYYLNPFLYNPSYIAPNGYAELFLNYRMQWVGFDGAPSTATANFHYPLSYKMGIGASFIHDKAGLLTTTTGLLSYGYQIYLGKDKTIPHKIGFGLSAGLTNSNISSTDATNPLDPALANNKTSSMDAQFGLHYQNRNFRIGFALPKLVKSYINSAEDFNAPEPGQFNSTISTLSYNFRLSPRLSFEPTALYRTEQDAPSQWEALGVFNFDNLIWVGGSYRQDYGGAGFLGLNIKNTIKISYAYEFLTGDLSSVGNGSHEVQMAIRLGKAKTPNVAKNNKPAEETIVAQEEPVETPVEEKTVETKVETEPVQTSNTESTTPQHQNGVADPVKTEPEPVVTKTPVTTTTEQAQEPVTENATAHKPTTLDGDHLAQGHYVVVGAFFSLQNAKNYTATLKHAGYPANIAFYPPRKYYIVHMKKATTLDEAKELRNVYRAKSKYSFRDTWILSVE